jgi:hypothetical protein
MKIAHIALIALASLALAGCATSSKGQPQDGTASTNPAMSSADHGGNGQASPYDQPLMAAGGDLVMLQTVLQVIAG